MDAGRIRDTSAVWRVCQLANLDADAMLLSIEQYAKRNEVFHSAARDFIDKRHWRALAEMLKKDLDEHPRTIPKSRADEIDAFRSCILSVRNTFLGWKRSLRDNFGFGVPPPKTRWSVRGSPRKGPKSGENRGRSPSHTGTGAKRSPQTRSLHGGTRGFGEGERRNGRQATQAERKAEAAGAASTSSGPGTKASGRRGDMHSQ